MTKTEVLAGTNQRRLQDIVTESRLRFAGKLYARRQSAQSAMPEMGYQLTAREKEDDQRRHSDQPSEMIYTWDEVKTLTTDRAMRRSLLPIVRKGPDDRSPKCKQMHIGLRRVQSSTRHTYHNMQGEHTYTHTIQY